MRIRADSQIDYYSGYASHSGLRGSKPYQCKQGEKAALFSSRVNLDHPIDEQYFYQVKEIHLSFIEAGVLLT
jgi:hypothetical protein